MLKLLTKKKKKRVSGGADSTSPAVPPEASDESEVLRVVDEPELTEVYPDWPVPTKPPETLAHGTTYPKEVNSSIFELYAPEGQHKLDVVFFHGLQIGTYRTAYVETWMSGTTCWPQEWLPEDFPMARILSVSYDSSARRSKVEGQVDLPKLGATLVEDVIVSAGVGAKCPVILVGHSLGGIVIKQLCLDAEKNKKLSHPHRNKCIKNFLKNIRGIFYYSVPHGGSSLANLAKNYVPSPGPMLEYLSVLSTHTEEINGAFRQLRQTYRWRADAVSEGLITKIGLFRAIVVTAASAEQDVDNFELLEEDHISICKPRSRSTRSYVIFKEFIHEVTPF